jgi:hypothetical protein
MDPIAHQLRSRKFAQRSLREGRRLSHDVHSPLPLPFAPLPQRVLTMSQPIISLMALADDVTRINHLGLSSDDVGNSNSQTSHRPLAQSQPIALFDIRASNDDVTNTDATSSHVNNITPNFTTASNTYIDTFTIPVTNTITSTVTTTVTNTITNITNYMTTDFTNDVTNDITNDITTDITNDITTDMTTEMSDITSDIEDDIANTSFRTPLRPTFDYAKLENNESNYENNDLSFENTGRKRLQI